jgi:E3 ubiquitin-protein ligase TRIP12
MTNLYIYVKSYMGENLVDDKTLSSTKRKKVRINRENIFNCADRIMKESASYNGYLEFEYNEEIGTGQGPTLEFYSLLFQQFKDNKDLWYKYSDNSLFPKPVSHLSDELRKNLKKTYQIMGYFIARALYDDRLMDFPLNSVFWDLVLERVYK